MSLSHCWSDVIFATWQDPPTSLLDMVALVKAGRTCQANRADALGQTLFSPVFLSWQEDRYWKSVTLGTREAS
jgi:hypothetical protein